MDILAQRNEFAARIAAYQAAHAVGEDIFAEMCRKDDDLQFFVGGLVWWLGQQPEPEYRAAAESAIECW